MSALNGTVSGYVVNNYTGLPIPGASVRVAGLDGLSAANGSYSFSLPIGSYYLLANLSGYGTFLKRIDIGSGLTLRQNITMAYAYGNVTGIVMDRSANKPLAGVMVSAGGVVSYSGSGGWFNFEVLTGTHTIAATKGGYANYVSNVSVGSGRIVTHSINMTAIKEERLNGTVFGYAFDNSTGLYLGDVTVSIAGSSAVSGASGYYNLSAVEGSHAVAAYRSGYMSHIGSVTIIPNSAVSYNFTMQPMVPIINVTRPAISERIIRNITEYVNTLFNFTENMSSRAYVLANRNQTGIYVQLDLYQASPPGVDDPDFLHLGKYYTFTSNINASTIINISYNISYEDLELPPYFDERYLAIFYFNPRTLKWEEQRSAVDESRNMVVTKIGHFSTYVIGMKTGIVYGRVTVKGTNTTVKDATVVITGHINLSDASGGYRISSLCGEQTIISTKGGYLPYLATVQVCPGGAVGYVEAVRHDIELKPIEYYSILGSGHIRGVVTTTLGVPLDRVTVSVGGMSAVTNASGNYSLTVLEGTYNLVAVREGYDNYIALVNISQDNTTVHDIAMTVTLPPGAGPGAGAGSGSGSGAGKGAGKGSGQGSGTGIERAPILEAPVEITEHRISLKHILKKLSKGTYVEVPVYISNYRDEAITLNFDVTGEVAPLIKLDHESMAIGPSSEERLNVVILGNVESGVYEGELIISGDIQETIIINVLIYPKDKLDIEALVFDLIPLQKRVSPGDELKYRVDLQNMLAEERYLVSLSYYLQSLENNNTFFIEDEETVVLTSHSLQNSLIIPPDLEPGEYALIAEAKYLGYTSIKQVLIQVVQPFYKYAMFGLIPLWMILAAAALLSTITYSTMMYKKKAKAKKRYMAEFDTSHLPVKGPRSAYIGLIAETSSKTYFDLDQLQVHTLIAGSSGSGKTVAAQDIVEEALLKDVSVIVFDPTAHWTGFLRKCEDPVMLKTYRQYGMKRGDARAFNGNIRQVTDAREKLAIGKFMKPGEINVFVTNKLGIEESELFVANTIRAIFHANLPESPQLKTLVVYDGIHTLLPKFGGSGKVFIQLERAAREFRKWGVGLLMISQVQSDFPPEVLANINTEILLRTRDEGDMRKLTEGYGDNILKSVVKANVGTGMIENSSYNQGKPYFVSFRSILHQPQPLTAEDLSNYNKYNDLVDDLEWQIKQFKEEGIDTFDLELDLKLASDKVKAGNFNMVDIYLEGLTPRLEAQWKKLGKKPKKYKIEFVSEKELEAEMKPKGPASPTTEIDGHITVAEKHIENGDIASARDVYKIIRAMYKGLPAVEKKKYAKRCMEIQRALNHK
ncbi:MAG: carboxypeptidase regulatory-like domain-containing protein [archaeon]